MSAEYPITTSYEDNIEFYGYVPSLVMGAIFLSIFSVSTVVHIYQTFRCRQRWIVVMATGGVLECLGWGFRILSRNGAVYDGYIGQLCCLIIAPTFFSAAMFKITFLVADFISLVLQAAGGGIAATAETDAMSDVGSNLMLGGIVFQLAVMVISVAYGLVWGYRSKEALRAAGPKLAQLLFGMAVCSAAIILRGAYRSAELSQGFAGALARDEMTFLLDAIPMSVAIIVINIFHPHRLLDASFDSLDRSESTELHELDKSGEVWRA